MNDMNVLTSTEEQTLVSLLSKLEPGFLPFDIFHQFARLYVSPIVIIVPLRKNISGDIEVLLTRREATDPIWPNQLALTGTVLRATDAQGSFTDAFKRILVDELENIQIKSEPVFIDPTLYKASRGTELILIHWVEVSGETKVGQWHSVTNLPSDLIATEIPTINTAVMHFSEQNH